MINIKKDDVCNNYKIYKKILYSDIENNIKSGDLLLFDHNLTSIHERTFAHRQFSHIGIVIKNNGILYSYDMNPDNLQYDILNNEYGNKLVPLYERISNYYGDVFIASLKNKLNKQQEDYLISRIKKNKYAFLSNFKIVLSFLFDSRNNYKNEKICSEFIAELLDKLKITNNIKK